MPANLKNSAVATGLEDMFFIPDPKTGSAKECSKYWKTEFFSDVSRVIFTFFKLDFNSTCTENFQMYKLNLEKAEEQEIKLSTSAESRRKHQNSRETSTSASLTP